MIKPQRTDAIYNEYVKDFYRHIEDYDWNDVTDHWRGLESVLHRYRERQVMRLLRSYGTGEKYLDIGCGTGLILRHLPAGSVGIDLNERHLSRARKYAPKAHVQIGDAEQLPFEASSFDTIVCTEVLEHLVFPEKALSEINRVLKTGGWLIGSTPAHAMLWRMRFLSSTHYHNEPFHNEFTQAELNRLFASFNYALTKKRFFHSMFFFVVQKQ